jgi:hypothetical protein
MLRAANGGVFVGKSWRDYEDDVRRVFTQYIEPKSEGKTLTASEWNVLMRKEGFKHRNFNFFVTEFIKDKHGDRVFMPSVTHETEQIVEKALVKVKRAESKLRREGKRIPRIIRVHRHNLAQARRHKARIGIRAAKKLATFSQTVTIRRLKRTHETRFKVGRISLSLQQFNKFKASTRVIVDKRTGRLTVVPIKRRSK